jgi:Na+/proline symporter
VLDQKNIFPNFIMHVLPMGLRGLVFAGLFAAAISSLGATLNAVTTAWLKDIRGGRSDAKQGLGHVRALTVVFGIALCGVGLFFSWWAQDKGDDLVQIALGAMTILYGGILGAFLSALLLARRGSDASVTTGMAVGVVLGTAMFFQRGLFGLDRTVIAWPWSIPIAAAACMLVAAFGVRRPAPLS